MCICSHITMLRKEGVEYLSRGDRVCSYGAGCYNWRSSAGGDCMDWAGCSLVQVIIGIKCSIYRVKWRHSNQWSHYCLYVARQHGVQCEVVKICRLIRIKLNQLVKENVYIITILLRNLESDVTMTNITQSLPHICGKHSWHRYVMKKLLSLYTRITVYCCGHFVPT